MKVFDVQIVVRGWRKWRCKTKCYVGLIGVYVEGLLRLVLLADLFI